MQCRIGFLRGDGTLKIRLKGVNYKPSLCLKGRNRSSLVEVVRIRKWLIKKVK